jgi:hypothetical protein
MGNASGMERTLNKKLTQALPRQPIRAAHFKSMTSVEDAAHWMCRIFGARVPGITPIAF